MTAAAHAWQFSDSDFSAAVNAWPDPEAGALIGWSRHAVDSLHYLVDLDDQVFADSARPSLGHRLQIVDLAHMRWACITAITAIDLCAGAIWRLTVTVPPDSHDVSLRGLDPRVSKTAGKRHQRLDPVHRAWVDQVLNDPHYAIVHKARNPMTHSRIPQTHYAGNVTPGPHEQRSGFRIGPAGSMVDARDLVEMARDLATRHVDAFLRQVVPSGP